MRMVCRFIASLIAIAAKQGLSMLPTDITIVAVREGSVVVEYTVAPTTATHERKARMKVGQNVCTAPFCTNAACSCAI